MSLSRIILRLARNPGTEFAEGDDHRGYAILAPLTADGRINEAEIRRQPAKVRRFASDEDPREGEIRRHGGAYVIDYDGDDQGGEPIYRVGDHRFALGEYVSITDEEGRLSTYKVTEVSPA
jgi:hypothetical protein